LPPSSFAAMLCARMSQSPAKSVFVSVAEQSADEHVAAVIRAVHAEHPQVEFRGFAGPQMQAAGCECLEDLTAESAMAVAAFKKIPWALKLMRRVSAHLAEHHYDLALTSDSPALHLPMAKRCQKAGVPVMFFIAPQTWAWGPPNWRNQRVRARVNRLACIWPFEVPYFKKAGIDAIYVGHPSFDRLSQITPDANAMRSLRHNADPLITILPGSRGHEIAEILPGQLEVLAALRRHFANLQAVIVVAGESVRAPINQLINTIDESARPRLIDGDQQRADAICAADLVLATSGTVTLEVAYWNTPMIVMYNTNRVLYQLIGRHLIRTPYLSIPNIIAGREMVPEFMPYYTSTEPIAQQALEWLQDRNKLDAVRADLKATINPLVKTGAPQNVAREVLKMLGLA